MLQKIVFLFFINILYLFAETSVQSNQFDREIIVKDFVDGNKNIYYKDNIQSIDKKTAIADYLSDDAATRSVGKCSTAESTAEIIDIFKCPTPKEGFSTSIYNINFKNQSTTCLVAKEGVLEKPIALFRWNLSDYSSYDKDCETFYKKDTKAVYNDEVVKDAIELSRSQFASLNQARIDAVDSGEIEGANTGIPHIIAATLLGDSDLIDVQQSLNHNTLVLKEGFIPKGSNFLKTREISEVGADTATYGEVWDALDLTKPGSWGSWLSSSTALTLHYGANALGMDYNPDVVVKRLAEVQYDNEKASDVITSRLIALLGFYPKWSMLNQDFYLMMVAVFGLAGVVFFGASKIAKKIDELNEHESKVGWFSGIILTAVAFLPTTVEDITLTEGNMKLSQNIFQNIEITGYYTTIDFANGIAKIIIDNELDSMARKAGLINSNIIVDSQAQNNLDSSIKDDVELLVSYCSSVYDSELLKTYSENPDKTYPMSEQWTYASYTAKGRVPRYYMSKDEGGLLNINNENKYPTLSLTACRNMVNKQSYLNDQINRNNTLLAEATTNVDDSKIAKLKDIYRAQYGIFNEWGYMGLIALPTIVYKSESLGTLFKKDEDDNIVKRLTDKEILDEEFETGLIKNIIKNTPYFMLPGVMGIFNLFKDVGTAVGEMVPFFDGIGKFVGGAAGSIIGFQVSLDIAKNLLSVLPIVGIVLFGLLINLKIIVKIFTYHLMAPFVMLLAFTKQNVQLVMNYIARVISIMLEIPIFAISIFAAMAARDILLAIGTPLSSAIMKIMLEVQESQQEVGRLYDGNYEEHVGNWIFIGVTEVGLHIFAFVIIYKILTTYHTQIFEAVEMKAASSFDQAVESAKQDAQGWGTRV